MPRLKVSQKRETFRDHNSRSVRKSLLAEWVDISIKIAGAAVYDVSIPYGTTQYKSTKKNAFWRVRSRNSLGLAFHVNKMTKQAIWECSSVVEQQTFNLWVEGSSPSTLTNMRAWRNWRNAVDSKSITISSHQGFKSPRPHHYNFALMCAAVAQLG